MKKTLTGACLSVVLSVPAVASAALFDFQAWIANNSEQGFTNSSPFQLTDSGVTLTATAYESPNMTDSNVYMDGLFNNIIGGMGVCTTLTGNNQCTPSSDDNVSIDGTNGETLSWSFSQSITQMTLELGNADHFDFAGSNFEYRLGGGAWNTGTTDANGFVTLLLSSADPIDFRPVGVGFDNQFYIRNADVTVVPVPAAVWLFGSGLIGLVGVARRRR